MARQYREESYWEEDRKNCKIVVKQDIYGYWWAWVDGFPVNALFGDPNRVRVTTQARKLVDDLEASDEDQA